MDIAAGMIISFSALIYSVSNSIFVGIPLILSFLIFSVISLKRGFSARDILSMSYEGSRKAFVVLRIFILIGAITSVWMASGTVPAIVYYGIKIMNPDYFIIYAFLITAATSFLLGTSLGTVGTVGIALIVMAKGGNVDVNLAAGAIISGSYFGDRCSPMSSSASLVASLTDTELFTNIRNMFESSVLPFIITVILYGIFSLSQPLVYEQAGIFSDINASFDIAWPVLIPAVIIIIFSLMRINVRISMSLSILSAAVISIIIQDQSPLDVIRQLIFGFYLEPENPLHGIIKGGGIISMWKASVAVVISCAIAGIFEGTQMLMSVESLLKKATSRAEVFFYTIIVSIVTAAFGCSQSISTVLTSQLMKKTYESRRIHKYDLALNLENTGIVLSALIPWNTAAFLPTTTMDVSYSGFIPYAFYLYLLPLINLVIMKIRELRKGSESRVISYSDMDEDEKAQALSYMRINDKLEDDYIRKCIEGKIYDRGRGMFFAFNDREVTCKGFLVMETIETLGCAYIHKVSAIQSYFEDCEKSCRSCIENGILETIDRLKAFAEENGAEDVRLGFSDSPSQLRLMELFKGRKGCDISYRSFIMKLNDDRRFPEADTLELRDIQELSMKEYAQLYNDSFEGAPHRSFMGEDEALEAFSGRDDAEHFIVWDGAVKTGFLDFYEDRENSKGKFDLGIVRDKRGLGYGRRILETAIQHLAEKNLEVELIVLEPNTVAFEMYKKRGFEIRSIMGHWIRL